MPASVRRSVLVRRLVTVAVTAALLEASLQACSLLFPLVESNGPDDGGGGGDVAGESVVDARGDGGDSALADGPVDASHFDETPYVPEAGCVESGAACITPAPASWQGPFIVYDGNEANAPSCTAPDPNQILTAYGDLNSPPPAQCSPACGCNPPTGGTCSNKVTVHGLASCVNCGTTDQVAVGSCIYGYGQLLDCQGFAAGAIQVDLVTADGGSCSGTAQTVMKPAYTWQRLILGCTAGSFVQADCPEGDLCVPLGTTPFEAKACVMQMGDVACPGQPYSAKRLVYAGADDTRDCSPCTCGPPTGNRTCATSVALYGANNTYCNGNPTHQAAPLCVGEQDMQVTANGPPTGGSCASTGGGTPIGGVTPSSPITVCCIP